jgi:hypothetical protein
MDAWISVTIGQRPPGDITEAFPDPLIGEGWRLFSNEAVTPRGGAQAAASDPRLSARPRGRPRVGSRRDLGASASCRRAHTRSGSPVY